MLLGRAERQFPAGLCFTAEVFFLFLSGTLKRDSSEVPWPITMKFSETPGGLMLALPHRDDNGSAGHGSSGSTNLSG